MNRTAAGDGPGDTPFGDRDTPFGSPDTPLGASGHDDPVRDEDAVRASTPAPTTSPPPGDPDAPIIPDPPAPGTLPPAGVPFTGKERLRRDPGLGWAWLAIVVAIMAAGVVLIALGLWQAGSCLIGGAMIVGAVMRFSIPSREIGLLRVRGRIFDGLWMLAIGIGIIAMVLARS